MKYIITGGGTGGHIYPALAIADKIKKEDKKCDILYIGTHNRMEKDIVPLNNIKYKSIEMYGLKRSLSLSNFKSLYCYLKSINRVKNIIKKFKPDCVIGVGGYVTYPVISCAKKLGFKTVIHEQNSIPGLSNRKLEKYSDKIFVSFESSKEYFNDLSKVIYSGNPVGDKAISSKAQKLSTCGLDDNKKTIIIVMGSLGSKTVLDRFKLMLPMFKNKDYQILFITGKNYYEEFDSIKVPSNIHIKPYIDNLSGLLKNAYLLVSRAGASTISEIEALKLPTIFIPSPYVTDNHQYKNAMDLVNKNRGLLLEEKELSSDKLVRLIDDIMNDKKKYNEIKDNLINMKIVNSTDIIYSNIVKLIERK